MRADRPASSMSVATVLRKLCGLMSGTPNSSRLLRHCPAKLSGSRSVPLVYGKMTDCSPRYGRLRRSESIATANAGSGITRRPATVFVSSTRTRPLAFSRTTLPADRDRSGVGIEVAPAQRQQFGAAQACRDQEGDRVGQIALAARLRRAKFDRAGRAAELR